MKTWSEIKQATLHKLFLDEQEAQQQGYLAKFRYFANECLNIIANGVKPRIATFETVVTDDNTQVRMPDDFLSFTDIVNYANGEQDPDIIYVDDKNVMLSGKGTFKIFYNALWHYITEEDVNSKNSNNVLPIDQSVLNCLPTYIASQCLAQDDIQRSTILKNDFELMLSRLDTNMLYQENHYKSTGGWY